jgi:hypothetical protein
LVSVSRRLRRIALVAMLLGPCALVGGGCAGATPPTADASTPPAEERSSISPATAVAASWLRSRPIRVGVERVESARSDLGFSFATSMADAASARIESMRPGATIEEPEPRLVVMAVGKPEALGRIVEEEDRGGLRFRTWEYDDESIKAIDNTAERMTLRFFHELMGEDRRRLHERLTTPILLGRMHRRTEFDLDIDRREREAEEELLAQIGPSMMDRPLRSLLKEFDFVRSVDIALEDFKAEHVPLSDAWQERHESTRDFGRFAVRLRMNPADPLRVDWIRKSWRVGLGAQAARVRFERRIESNIHVGAQIEQNWERGDFRFSGSFVVEHGPRSRSVLLVSDRMDFLGGPTRYQGIRSPIDGDPGLMFYFEQQF